MLIVQFVVLINPYPLCHIGGASYIHVTNLIIMIENISFTYEVFSWPLIVSPLHSPSASVNH